MVKCDRRSLSLPGSCHEKAWHLRSLTSSEIADALRQADERSGHLSKISEVLCLGVPVALSTIVGTEELLPGRVLTAGQTI